LFIFKKPLKENRATKKYSRTTVQNEIGTPNAPSYLNQFVLNYVESKWVEEQSQVHRPF
jgi:hypothetical protein